MVRLSVVAGILFVKEGALLSCMCVRKAYHVFHLTVLRHFGTEDFFFVSGNVWIVIKQVSLIAIQP